MRAWMAIALATTLLLTLACGRKTEAPDSHQAYEAAIGETDTVMRIASLQTWLADYCEASGEDRAAAMREIWSIHEMRREEAAGLAWVRSELEDEPSDAGKGMLYSLLFQYAKEKMSKDTALQVAQELWDANVVDPETLNRVGWALVADPGWDPDLGARLAERGAEHAEPGGERASLLDTAGWGYYLLGKKDPARRLLEAAHAELGEPNREIRQHLAMFYERIGEEVPLLELWTQMLHDTMDSELQAKAEALHAKQGGLVEAYREKLWEVRMENAASAPDFEMVDLQGRKHQLSEYRGKVVMLNFWHPT